MTRPTAREAATETAEWTVLETLDCSTCGQPMPFQALDCIDGHDEDCPDRVCMGCGLVLVVGPAPLLLQRGA